MFSVYTNGKNLFSLKNSGSPEQIDCLHGIRSIATMWIALAHVYNFFVWLPIRNRFAMNEVFNQYLEYMLEQMHRFKLFKKT